MQTSNRIIRQAKMLYTVQNASFAKYVIIPKSSVCKLFPLINTSLEIWFFMLWGIIVMFLV